MMASVGPDENRRKEKRVFIIDRCGEVPTVRIHLLTWEGTKRKRATKKRKSLCRLFFLVPFRLYTSHISNKIERATNHSPIETLFVNRCTH